MVLGDGALGGVAPRHLPGHGNFKADFGKLRKTLPNRCFWSLFPLLLSGDDSSLAHVTLANRSTK